MEQIYYFLRRWGKMKIEVQIHEVWEVTRCHLPPETRHQIINDGDDWIEHLIVNAKVG